MEILQSIQNQGGWPKTRKNLGAFPDPDQRSPIALDQGGEDSASLRQCGGPAGFARIGGPQAQGPIKHQDHILALGPRLSAPTLREVGSGEGEDDEREDQQPEQQQQQVLEFASG